MKQIIFWTFFSAFCILLPVFRAFWCDFVSIFAEKQLKREQFGEPMWAVFDDFNLYDTQIPTVNVQNLVCDSANSIVGNRHTFNGNFVLGLYHEPDRQYFSSRQRK